MIAKSPRLGVPVVGLRVVINDGASHAVDSSDIAFQEAARGAFRDFFPRATPKILEPIMKLSVEGPAEFSGNIRRPDHAAPRHRHRLDRRGRQRARRRRGAARRDVRLLDAAALSSTQGKAEFTMEFAKYAETPTNITEELLKKAAAAKEAARK